MTTTNRPDALDVLTHAADAAGRIATDATQGKWSVAYYNGPLGVDCGDVVVADCSNDETRGSLSDPYLIAASNPDHWRTIAAMLRTAVEWNGLVAAVELRTPEDYATSSTTIAALLPLAEQVLRDLATATGGAA